MDYQVLARKKRPQVFEAIIGQEHITKTLQNAISSGRIAHAFLFTGIRGVGKTTCARVLAKALNCRKGPEPNPCNECDICEEITKGSSLDVIEIDAASNRGINEIRELRENVKFTPATGKYKIYIIDEVHMLTREAFNALLKTLEEPPPHVIFILATTEPFKLPPTILSRCQRYDFRPMSKEGILGYLKQVVKEEKIKIDEKALFLISEAADGSMRDSLSILESLVSVSDGKIEYQQVADILGVIDTNLLLSFSDALIAKDSDRILFLIDEFYSHGYDIKQFCKHFLNHLRDLIVTSMTKEEKFLATGFQTNRNQLKEQGLKIPYENWLQYFSIFYEAEKELRRTDNPKLMLEVTFLKMLRVESVIPLQNILNQITELKESLHINSQQLDEKADNSGNSSPKGPVQRKEPYKNSSVEESQAPYQHKKEEKNDKFSWEEFIKCVEEESISLASFLSNGCSKKIEGDKLVFGFEDSFSVQMINKDKNIRLLKNVAESLLGKKIGVIVRKENLDKETNQHDSATNEERKARESLLHRALKEPVIKDILDIFPGKIVDVKVLK